MDDSPPKYLKIGKTSIGLIGLEPAMRQALAENLDKNEAADALFTAISRQNYVPPQAEEKYRAALAEEYERRLHGTSRQNSVLAVKVFGTGCVTCDKLEGQIFDILARLGMAADIEKISELDDIWRHGVLSPPALKINDTIVCQGRMPTPVQIEQWLKEAGADSVQNK